MYGWFLWDGTTSPHCKYYRRYISCFIIQWIGKMINWDVGSSLLMILKKHTSRTELSVMCIKGVSMKAVNPLTTLVLLLSDHFQKPFLRTTIHLAGLRLDAEHKRAGDRT